MKYEISLIGSGKPFIIEGEQLQRDKTNPELSNGYCFYFLVNNEIKVYSAFHYEVKPIE